MKIGIPSGLNRPIDSIERQRESVETLLGSRGDPLDRAVTYRDLVDSGIASLAGVGIIGGGNGTLKPTPQPPGGLPKPPTPANLQATGMFSGIFLNWEYNNYDGHSHTEVWRASSNNLGNALIVGTTAAKVYTDYVTTTGVTYYYWVRNVSVSGEKSPFNATSGTSASVVTDPAYLLGILTGAIGNSQLNTALSTRITSIETTAASIETQIDDLYETFGNSQSSADNLAAAQAAAQAAIDAKVEAIGAKDVAVQAKVDAITAKDGSVVAKDTAVAAQTAASTSAGNALSSANNAATSASTAATNAATASTAASSATAARTAAESANTAAQTASAAAATSATNAATYATNAGTAATAATNAKISAESAKTDAQTSATAAATSASTASTAATNAASASTSATTAKNAAEAANTAAGNSAAAAASSATSASGFADTASAASTASNQSKLDAQAARDSAQTSATAAATSATNASASATASANSATAANTSKLAAETAKVGAETARDASVTAKNAAEVAKTDAVSAKNDAQSASAAAATSQTAAANSATSASNSATASAGSASTAATKATEAATSSTAANAAKVDAQSARDAANTYSVAAAGSAQTASTKADAAQTSANAASGSATTATAARDAAEGFKNTAQSQANAAATSASNASASATSASNSATSSTNSANSASTSAANALTYRNQAAQSASDASGYATASAQDYSVINARLNNFGGSGVTVEQNATATASTLTGLNAQYTVKIDNNGYVSGFGLASSAPVNGTPSSEFIVRADRFSIGSPGQSTVIPFIVQATATTINGVSVPAGVYINDAYIRNGTITNAKIANAAIDDAKIINLSANKITAGTIDAERISINTNVLTSVYNPSTGRNMLQISGGAITNDLIATNANIDGAKIGTLNVAKLTGDVTKFLTGYAAPSGAIPATFTSYVTLTLPKSDHAEGHKPYIQVSIRDAAPYQVGGYLEVYSATVGDGTSVPALGPIYPASQQYWYDYDPEFGYPELMGWTLFFSGEIDIQIGDTITNNNSQSGTVSYVLFNGSQTMATVEAQGSLGSYYTRTRPVLGNGVVGPYTLVLDTYWDAYDMTSVSLFGGLSQTTQAKVFDVRVRGQWANALYIKAIDVVVMGIR